MARDHAPRVVLGSEVYRQVNTVVGKSHPRGDELGTGSVIGCDGRTLEGSGVIRFFAVSGVDSDIAVVAVGVGRDRDVTDTYVSEDVPVDEIPSSLTR